MSDATGAIVGSQAGRAKSAFCNIAAALALLLGFALGAAGLNMDIVWLDEMFSLGDMGAPDPPFSPSMVSASVSEHSPDQVPLYFVLASQWAQLVGWAQVPVRYFSLLAGILSLAFLYRFAADIFDRRAALVAVLLLVSNTLFVGYWHEIKVYALFALLAVAHTWIYWRIAVRGKFTRSYWLLFVITGIAALYTHMFSLFLFAGLFVQHLLYSKWSKGWLKAVLGWGLISLAIVPYLDVFSVGFDGVTNSARTQAMSSRFSELAPALAAAAVNDVLLLWFPLIVLGGLALFSRKDAASRRLFTVLAIAVSLILAANEVVQVISVFRLRYFVFLIPFFVVLIAHIITRVRYWKILTAVFLLLWLAGFYWTQQQAESWAYAGRRSLLSDHPPLHQFADSLQGKTRKHDFIIGFADSPMINWPLKHGWNTADYYTQTVLGIDGAFVNARLRGDELQNDIERRIDSNPYLLFAYDPQDKSEVFDDVLAAILVNYESCAVVVDSENVFVQRFVLYALPCDKEYEPIHYENGIWIVDKFADFDSDRQTVRVVTGWEVADEAQLEEYNVSIQILAPDWTLVRQARDRHLYNKILKWYVTELSTAGLSPGDYRVVVILYDRYDSSSKVAGIDETTGEVGTILPILHFKIDD